VFEAAVIAIEHPTWQERPLLIVQPKPGHSRASRNPQFLSDKIANGGCRMTWCSSIVCRTQQPENC